MRVKTDERRQGIMDAAAEIFREVGYERASMAAIAARVGGSKSTLYSYFKSKEELFTAVMLEGVDAQAQQMFAMLEFSKDRDLRTILEAFGRTYLDLLLSPDLLALMRIGIAEGGIGELGPSLYERGAKRGWDEIAAKLARWIEEAYLCPCDPQVAALHLKGFIEAGVVEPRLYGAEVCITPYDAVRLGVDRFLRAYAPGKD